MSPPVRAAGSDQFPASRDRVLPTVVGSGRVGRHTDTNDVVDPQGVAERLGLARQNSVSLHESVSADTQARHRPWPGALQVLAGERGRALAIHATTSVTCTMTSSQLTTGPCSAEIVAGESSGRTNASHKTVISAHMARLDAVPAGAPPAAVERAALEPNASSPVRMPAPCRVVRRTIGATRQTSEARCARGRRRATTRPRPVAA
jgi:hypothetical protein